MKNKKIDSILDNLTSNFYFWLGANQLTILQHIDLYLFLSKMLLKLKQDPGV